MNVSEAVAERMSVRVFLDTPVENKVIEEVLTKAARSPSGGNVQPWRIYVINGESMKKFNAIMEEKLESPDGPDEPEYLMYPPSLKEPYRTTRFKLGEDMYKLLDISREEKPKRLEWQKNNQRFFGAPAAVFCYMDRCMGPPQWSDLGMYLQTAMLLFEEAGLNTCPQESWSLWHQTVTDFVGAPDEEMMFCALAVGYKDSDHPVNSLNADREPFEKFGKFV